ncbi:MAG: proton-conducting membrane transporter [Oscillospiraceae bacterium]|nr:proton-conducting membrane transporter [Oscillospiraceae bacterium]
MLSFFVVAPILIAVFLYLFSNQTCRLLAITAQAVLVGFACYLFYISRDQAVITVIGDYDGSLGITLVSDYIASVFVLLTALIFLIAAIYSFHEYNTKMFWFLLFIWESLLIGIFLSRDFFNIFVLLEVATVIVSILIMFDRNNRSMYDGIIYLMINIVAIQFFLFGIGYVYKFTGTLDMHLAALSFAELGPTAALLPHALIMTAVGFKCALLPLFSWLPKAHGTPGAPSPVSAILSGLQIKIGLYLFLRFQTVFEDIAVTEFFLFIGVITGIVGVILAITEKDIKLILAYSTVAQMGLIMVGLGIDGAYAYIGSLYHIVNHAVFKSALFLSAGVIIHTYHTRNIYEIQGVLRRSPIIGIATIMAVFGITGTPLFNGSISKYFMMSGAGQFVSAAMILINLGTIIVFIRFARILFGHCQGDLCAIKRDRYQEVAVLILCLFCFVGGIFGEEIVQFLFGAYVAVSPAGYLEKTGIFFASWAAGYLIVKYVIERSKLLGKVRMISLNFRGMCASLGVFFAVVLLVSSYFTN